MTIHSIIPAEIIFAGMEQQTHNYTEVKMGGISLQIERVSDSQARIVRLLSCRPNDFLNPAFMPGTMIDYYPSLVY